MEAGRAPQQLEHELHRQLPRRVLSEQPPALGDDRAVHLRIQAVEAAEAGLVALPLHQLDWRKLGEEEEVKLFHGKWKGARGR